MKKSYITINGGKYLVEIIAGKRYIDNKPVAEFLAELDPLTISELFKVGVQAVVDEINGTKPKSYQKMMDRSYLIKKTNAN